MPQLQALVLKDRQATPVSHTFTPRNIVGGVGEVVESSGVPVGENRVTISLRKTQGGRYKGTLKMTFPIVQNQVVNGITTPVVVRSGYISVETDFDSTSSEAERNNAIGQLTDALGVDKVLINDTLVKLQGVY